MKKLLIAGCGALGHLVARQLQAADGWEVTGLRRNTDSLEAGIKPLAVDITDAYATERGLAGQDFDYVLLTLTPASGDEEGYIKIYLRGMSNLLHSLRKTRPRHWILISSSRVWGQDDGVWIDESTVPTPADFAGRRLLECEQLCSSHTTELSIVRLSGLYGGKSGGLIERVRRGAGCRRNPPLYTNRIHRLDAAGFIVHLLQQKSRAAGGESVLEPVYIGSDSQPAPLWDVMSWLAEQLGCASPAVVDDNHSYRRRYSRRLNNRLMRMGGYTLRYPDYRSGYSSILVDGGVV